MSDPRSSLLNLIMSFINIKLTFMHLTDFSQFKIKICPASAVWCTNDKQVSAMGRVNAKVKCCQASQQGCVEGTVVACVSALKRHCCSPNGENRTLPSPQNNQHVEMELGRRDAFYQLVMENLPNPVRTEAKSD